MQATLLFAHNPLSSRRSLETNETLRVPFGINSEGRLVAPAEAVKGQEYHCPSEQCGALLVLKQGHKILKSGAPKTTHFAHPKNSLCTPDLVTHAIAEQKIVQAIKDWKFGNGEKPVVKYLCPICNELRTWELPESIHAATREFPIAIGERSFRLDVATLPWESTQIAVEIYHKHKVEEEKHEALINNSIRVIEIEAIAAIENPHLWVMLPNQKTFVKCSDCQEKDRIAEQRRIEYEARRPQIEKEEREKAEWEEEQARESAKWVEVRRRKREQYLPKFREEAFQIARAQGIYLPRKFYRYFIVHCWKCSNRILAFTWPGKREYEPFISSEANEPRPETIRRVPKKGTREMYWANTCKVCESVQGETKLPYPDSWGYSYIDFLNDLGDIAISHFEGRSRNLL